MDRRAVRSVNKDIRKLLLYSGALVLWEDRDIWGHFGTGGLTSPKQIGRDSRP